MLQINNLTSYEADGLAVLKSKLAQQKVGWGLPAWFYTDEQAFHYDMKMLRREWFLVGSVAEFKSHGDYRLANVATDSIILIRDQDEIKGFHNICCHRGSQVLLQEQGSCANLVCHYHQWTYNLSGELIYAGNMGENFDAKQFRLKPVHVKNIAGILFVCLSDEAPTCDYEEEKLNQYIAPYQLDKMKLVYEENIIHDTNWKLIIENNRECYHCDSNHPELCSVADPSGFAIGEFDISEEAKKAREHFMDSKKSEWETLNLPTQQIDYDNDSWIRLQRYPLTNNAVSHTNDGKAACSKLFDLFPYAETSGLSLWTYPNTWHHYLNDYVLQAIVVPISAQKTLLKTKWLVHQDAKENEHYDLQNLIDVWVKTNQQDSRLFSSVMTGMNSSAYKPGPISPEEIFVRHFNQWYMNKLNNLSNNKT